MDAIFSWSIFLPMTVPFSPSSRKYRLGMYGFKVQISCSITLLLVVICSGERAEIPHTCHTNNNHPARHSIKNLKNTKVIKFYFTYERRQFDMIAHDE